jgi:tripartite-type tricarboxylate transporter receptor subunit TctC
LKRFKVLPEVPTLDETAVPGMEMSAWQGLLAPAGTPRAIIERRNAEVLTVLKHPELLAKLDAQGTVPLGSTPAEYGAYVKSELGRWAKIVRETGARAE